MRRRGGSPSFASPAKISRQLGAGLPRFEERVAPTMVGFERLMNGKDLESLNGTGCTSRSFNS